MMFVLPELRNPYSSYEPYIDAQTMEIHHLKHHAGYVKKVNQACVDNNIDCERIETLFENIGDYPAAIRNNAGGHYNHTIFWSILDDTMTTPSMELMNLINETFGSLEDFKAEFTKAALGVFGSGWCWLVLNDGKLEITTTKNQDNPLMSDINAGYPLIGVDVWEHAYYLKYQNKRVEYLNNIWALIDWDQVSMRFSQKPEMNDLA
ncbi:MAG: superoxide dismutase [Candidatus Pacebacteria bacterium]|nr:superoxide dismutase [Candidatus Paceibacterota bacterium]